MSERLELTGEQASVFGCPLWVVPGVEGFILIPRPFPPIPRHEYNRMWNDSLRAAMLTVAAERGEPS